MRFLSTHQVGKVFGSGERGRVERLLVFGLFVFVLVLFFTNKECRQLLKSNLTWIS